MEAIDQNNPPSADLAIVTISERPLGCFVSFEVSFHQISQPGTLEPPIDLAVKLLGLSPFGHQRGQYITFWADDQRKDAQKMLALLRSIDKLLLGNGIERINYQRTIVADSLFFAGLE